MLVTCSVVTGRDPETIIKFLKSLNSSVDAARVTRPDLEFRTTAIVNNPLDSTTAIDALAHEVVINPKPRGFAANHNEVLRRTEAAFHLVANDDVVVPRDTISVLLDLFMDPRNSNVGALSPLLRNPDQSLQPSTYSFPTLPSVALSWLGLRKRLPTRWGSAITRLARRGAGESRMWEHDREMDVQTFRGAFVLMRMRAVIDVGLMTEAALVGCEEIEWHKRLDDFGWRRLFTPATHVIHVGQVTTGGRADLELEYIKGITNYFAAHRGRLTFWLVRMMAWIRTALIASRFQRLHDRPIPRYGESVARVEHGGYPVETLAARRPPNGAPPTPDPQTISPEGGA